MQSERCQRRKTRRSSNNSSALLRTWHPSCHVSRITRQSCENSPSVTPSVFGCLSMLKRSISTIKSLLCKTTALAYFDTNKDSVLQVDSSQKGLGTVLMLDSHPIVFADKGLQILCRRHPFWSYPAWLTIADPPS